MNPNGFFKKPKVTSNPNKNPMDECTITGHSQGLMVDLHEWMYVHAHVKPTLLFCDGAAETMWRAVRKAIADVIDDKEVKISRWEEVKLNFAFSDLLRGAAPETCKCTFLQNFNTTLFKVEPRVSLNPFEYVASIRKWLRQLELHFGLYRYSAQIQ